jgi:hypothetical protein
VPFKKKYMRLLRELVFKDMETFKPDFYKFNPGHYSFDYLAMELVFLKDPKMAFKPMVELIVAMEE